LAKKQLLYFLAWLRQDSDVIMRVGWRSNWQLHWTLSGELFSQVSFYKWLVFS